LAQFFQAVGPAVQQGAMQVDEATDMLTGFARNFRLGKQAEDALERMGQRHAAQAQQPQQPKPDPEMLKMQAEQQQAQQELQAKEREAQAKTAADSQINMARIQSNEQMARDELAAKERIEKFKIEKEVELKRQAMIAEADLKATQEATRVAQSERDHSFKVDEAQKNHEFDKKKYETSELGKSVPQLEAFGKMLEAIVQAVQQQGAAIQEQGTMMAEAMRQLAAPRKLEVRRDASGKLIGGVSAPTTPTLQ
jgi:hypothetical protein